MGKTFVIHPFLFAAYPILFLYEHNMHLSLELHELIVPVSVSVAFTGVIFYLIDYFLKDLEKSGLITSLFLLQFYSYGHVYNSVDRVWPLGFSIVRHSFLLASNFLVLLLVACLILRNRANLDLFTGFLNVAGIFLVVYPSTSIGFYEFSRDDTLQSVPGGGGLNGSELAVGECSRFPDIYYIILDGYASNHTLMRFFGFDNHNFLEYLRGKGFYIASGSRSNYASSFLSLSSSLNMEYINYLSEVEGVKSNDRTKAVYMIKNSRVMRFLKPWGYKFVHFRSGSRLTDYNEFADLNIACGLSEFTNTLVKTTMFKVFEIDLRRRAVLCSFSEIPNVKKRIDEPRFVFAHIIVPHYPYIFDENGKPTKVIEFRPSFNWDEEGYLDQLIFVNKKVKDIVDELLSETDNQPVILLQADHGPSFTGEWNQPTEGFLNERMRILNAYYLPDDGESLLYESITPVNTFRVVFNHYFNTSYELLQDEVYFSNYSHPYEFMNVTSVFS
jgi:hypothetical protein